MAASKATIAYFEGRARIEPIRVMLEELAIPYEDERVSFEAWDAMKSGTPFGALPSYRSGDIVIFQSHAIIRHLARVHGLYGTTEADRVRCDVIEEAISDLNEMVGKAPWRPNFADERADYAANELRPTLESLERRQVTADHRLLRFHLPGDGNRCGSIASCGANPLEQRSVG